jgi:ribosomal protein L37AE/L43A
MKICEFITIHYYIVGFILIVRHQCVVMKSLKMINAQQARVTYANKNTKEKLHRTNVAVWFNKLCKSNHLTTPNYISPSAVATQRGQPQLTE